MSLTYECKNCKIAIGKFLKAKPVRKQDVEACEEQGWEFIVRKPRNKQERKKSVWSYSRDWETYNDIDCYLVDWEFEKPDLCKLCVSFIEKKFLKRKQK